MRSPDLFERAQTQSGSAESPQSPPPPPARATDRFDEFYAIYPRKVAPIKAREAFLKAVRKGANPEDIVAGCRRYSAAMAGNDKNFIAHPTTWINQQRWLDEDSASGGTTHRIGAPPDYLAPRTNRPPSEMTDDQLHSWYARMHVWRQEVRKFLTKCPFCPKCAKHLIDQALGELDREGKAWRV